MNEALDKALLDLMEWYGKQKRILPWRDNPTPYRVWVSEIMLQQTQVATVIPYFERFMERYPDIKSLAKDSEERLLSYWAGLGYYNRARNMRKSAKLILRMERFPDTREELLSLPGIGPYTTGAILSIAFHQPVALLDANVERVLTRLRRVEQNVKPAYKRKLWSLSQALVNRAHEIQIGPSDFNQSLMELGALLCVPESPDCENCPLRQICKAYQTNSIGNYPEKKPTKAWVRVDENRVCLIDTEGRVLLKRSGEDEWRAGLWDFPSSIKSLDGRGFFAKVQTKHVVTHHRINRSTRIYHVDSSSEYATEGSADFCVLKLADLVAQSPQSKAESPLAIGAALKKTAIAIQEYLERNPLSQTKLK